MKWLALAAVIAIGGLLAVGLTTHRVTTHVGPTPAPSSSQLKSPHGCYPPECELVYGPTP